MSRSYRVRVAGSIERVVHVEDGVSMPLELLPILPRERQAELLREELLRRGFVERGGRLERAEKEVSVSIDPQSGVVVARLAREVDVRVSGDVVTAGESDGKKELDASLERLVEARTQELQRALTDRLSRHLPDIQREVEAVAHEVTAAALKERARQLGEVQEIVEDREAGTLTIKVRV